MRSVATASLKTALETLTKIVEEGPRYSETEYSEEGKPVKSVTPQNVDLDAAKALAVLAIQAIKISGAGKSAPAADAPGGVKAAQPDLWDSKGNWDLKQPK